MCAPDREQVAHRAAAGVDDVLFENDLLQRALGLVQAEQREVFGHAQAVGESRVEGVDLPGRIARGGRQEEDPGLLARDSEST